MPVYLHNDLSRALHDAQFKHGQPHVCRRAGHHTLTGLRSSGQPSSTAAVLQVETASTAQRESCRLRTNPIHRARPSSCVGPTELCPTLDAPSSPVPAARPPAAAPPSSSPAPAPPAAAAPATAPPAATGRLGSPRRPPSTMTLRPRRSSVTVMLRRLAFSAAASASCCCRRRSSSRSWRIRLPDQIRARIRREAGRRQSAATAAAIEPWHQQVGYYCKVDGDWQRRNVRWGDPCQRLAQQ